MISSTSVRFLESVFKKFHKPEFIDPDPLSRVLNYPFLPDREIAALLCSALALGRVKSILQACDQILPVFGEKLHDSLLDMSSRDLQGLFRGFRYRFFGGEDIAALLFGIQQVLVRHHSLEDLMAAGYSETDKDLLPALEFFVRTIKDYSGGIPGILLSDARKGGACKRLHLFLRWLIRKDTVDPGGWSRFPASKLLVPVDTHVLSQARKLGLTDRKNADLKTVREITAAFSLIDPEDPVRFDFSLSRLGIHPDIRNQRIHGSVMENF